MFYCFRQDIYAHKFNFVLNSQYLTRKQIKFVSIILYFLFFIFIHDIGINIHMTYNNNDIITKFK